MSMNFAIHSLRSVVPNGTPLELGLYSTGSRRWLTNCRRYRGWEHPFIHTFIDLAYSGTIFPQIPSQMEAWYVKGRTRI